MNNSCQHVLYLDRENLCDYICGQDLSTPNTDCLFYSLSNVSDIMFHPHDIGNFLLLSFTVPSIKSLSTSVRVDISPKSWYFTTTIHSGDPSRTDL